MRLLVTGASGFVGNHVADIAALAGHEVIGCDRIPLTSSVPADFAECDVRDARALQALVKDLRPDGIVHAAAVTPAPGEEIERAIEIIAVNQESTLALLIAAHEADCERFVYFSSAAVYADAPHGEVLTEVSELAEPGGLYAQSKIAGERHCRWAREALHLDARALRIGPVYGQHERPTHSRRRMSAMYQAANLARSGDVISCNAPDTTYNWIHGDDVGRAVCLLLEAQSARPAFNLAGPPASMAQVLEVFQSLDESIRVEWIDNFERASLPAPVGAAARSMSSAAIEAELGFAPRVDLPQGIASILERLDGHGR